MSEVKAKQKSLLKGDYPILSLISLFSLSVIITIAFIVAIICISSQYDFSLYLTGAGDANALHYLYLVFFVFADTVLLLGLVTVALRLFRKIKTKTISTAFVVYVSLFGIAVLSFIILYALTPVFNTSISADRLVSLIYGIAVFITFVFSIIFFGIVLYGQKFQQKD